jgi:hypothetical protein
MKVYAHHNAAGQILSIVIDGSPANGRVTLAPRPGVLVTEIEDLDEKTLNDRDALRELAKTHVIERAQHSSKLVAKR